MSSYDSLLSRLMDIYRDAQEKVEHPGARHKQYYIGRRNMVEMLIRELKSRQWTWK